MRVSLPCSSCSPRWLRSWRRTRRKAEPELPDGTYKALEQIPQFEMPAGMKAELWAC